MPKNTAYNYRTVINLLAKGREGVYSEKELVTPALVILSEHPSGLKTSELIQLLENLLEPKGHNGEIMPGRQDSYFSQKVRNLKSHDTLTKKRLATYIDGNWQITKKGFQILKENKKVLEALKSQGFKPKKIKKAAREGDYSKIVVEEGALELKSSKQRKRSQKLRGIAVKEFKKKNENRLFCVVCGFDFSSTYGEYGKDYIEIHHTEPIHLSDMRGTKTTVSEALNKVVLLCSNCHSMIHRKKGRMLSVKNLKQIVKKTRLKARN